MGLDASAALIWGIPVTSHDEDTGEPTRFWDEENEDWREFDHNLTVRHYGHYEDDINRGILTSPRLDTLGGDCWEPTQVNPRDLATEWTHDKVYSNANDSARVFDLDVNFYADAAWWLVADFG